MRLGLPVVSEFPLQRSIQLVCCEVETVSSVSIDLFHVPSEISFETFKLDFKCHEFFVSKNLKVCEVFHILRYFLIYNGIWLDQILTDFSSPNPFVPNAPFLFPMETSQNLKVF